MSRRVLPAALVSALFLSACAGAPSADDAKAGGAGYPVDISSCGHTSTVTSQPKAAITMNQGATEVMLALGLEEQMAGTAYIDDAVAPRFAEAYASVDVLAAEYPSHEKVLAAEPDFVYGSYASAFTDEAAGEQQELADLGLSTYLSPFGCPDTEDRPAVTFDAVWDEIEAVGTAFGVADRAEKLRKEQSKQLDDISAAAAGKGLDVFWFDSGDKTALAGGGGSGPQLILDAVGATNVFGDLEEGWGEVSWEQVVDADPDVIVLADAAWSSADDKIELLRKDPVLSKLRAVQDEKFVTVAYSEATPGVRMVDGAQVVSDGLRELFGA